MNIEKGYYRHFKGNPYEVTGVAKHSETLEDMVVYRALYGEHGLWTRPASMWNETVERDGKRYKRFTYLPDDDPKTKKLLREVLKKRLDERLPEMERLTGIKAASYSIRDMKSCWGVCHIRQKTLTFNLKLVRYDDTVLDYIIVHELCHIKVPNHGTKFYAMVEKYIPDWQERKEKLR